jgi:hypothetical protein
MKIKHPVHAILAFTVAIVCGAMLFSCHNSAEKQQEKSLELALEQGSGENTWPKAIPEIVPKFESGIIDHTTSARTRESRSWGVFFKDVAPGMLDKYDALLKKHGFKTTKTTMGTEGSISAVKDSINVSLIVSSEMTHFSVQVSSL